MLSFKEFITEAKKKQMDYRFPDKISQAYTPQEIKGLQVRNKIASIGYGTRAYSRYTRIMGRIPNDNTSDNDVNKKAAALDFLFADKSRDTTLDSPATLYHATRHEVEFDKDGLTTIKGFFSTGLDYDKVLTHLTKEEPGKDLNKLKAHHVLEVKYEPHGNVPGSYIAHHSGRSSEHEVVLPPFTTLKHIATRQEGIHPETGKPILVHTVQPMFTHKRFDRGYADLSPEDKLKRDSYITRT